MMKGDTDGVRPVALGLGANLGQFSLLVLINAFVGGMVGLERTVLPLIAEKDFKIASKSVILSFIISFGVVKAFTNLLAGKYSDIIGRKRLLISGWLFALPVPLQSIWAPTWSWIAAANVLLGINQGLCWSTTVIMKIDLVGPKRRGFAMGLNEFAGYGAVALVAMASGYLASVYGLRPVPFYLGIAFAALGLMLSLVVRDTTAHAREEARLHVAGAIAPPPFREVFAQTSYRNPTLFACSQAGLINNLNDGMVWGLFPLLFASYGLDIRRIGAIKDGDRIVGNRTKVKVAKNKVAPPFRECEFDIMYGEGISREGDLLDLASNNRVVEKSGAWFSYKGERLGQGRENAKQTLKDNPEVLKRIENDVRRALGMPVYGEVATAEAAPAEQKKAAAASEKK